MIEAARRLRQDLGKLPLVSRIGLVLMVGAFVADLLMRMAPSAHQHMGHRPDDHLAHFVALGAMALVIAGVVVDGARRHRSRRRTSHAHR